MAYFNHAFQKTFLATGATLDDANVTDPFTGDPVTVSSDEGYLTQSILTIRLVHLLEVILRLTSLR